MIATDPSAAIVAQWSPWVKQSEVELATLPFMLKQTELEEIRLVTAALLVDDDPELDRRVLELRRRAQNIRFAIVLHKSTIQIGRQLGLLQPRGHGGRPRKSARSEAENASTASTAQLPQPDTLLLA